MSTSNMSLPRVAITYCTQCRWMLRAAYFAQELLTTFSTQIGEVALIPATGGLFNVELTYTPKQQDSTMETPQIVEAQKVLLWDRKARGGFPETKVLKQLVRDHIDPDRDLGHSDKHGKKKEAENEDKKNAQDAESVPAQTQSTDEGVAKAGEAEVKRNSDGTVCEDCR